MLHICKTMKTPIQPTCSPGIEPRSNDQCLATLLPS
ncbi:hypothetical protein X975_11182, partial [Stegodyphus mimosarum]